MSSYRHIVPNIYAPLSAESWPHGLPTDIDFRSGAAISAPVQGPLIYESSYTSSDQLQHFESELAPLMSERLVDALLSAGVSNLQLFPAQVSNKSANKTWLGFHTVNIIGVISCASPRSVSTIIAVRPDGVTPLAIFDRLLINVARTGGADMFRLAESPGTILVSNRVIDRLRLSAPEGGWNITAYPVEDD